MKLLTVAGAFLLFTVPVFAQPAPAGKCSLMDGGVATVGPTMKEQGLNALSTPLPKEIGIAVADVSFQILSDGAVSDVKLLCVAPVGNAGDAIVDTVKTWKFAPLRGRNAKPANVSYRVSASGAILLSFLPNVGLKPIEG